MGLLGYMIICSDSLESLKELPNDSIQTIITSPPYGIGKEYESKKLVPFHDVVKEFPRILKSTGSVFWQVGNWINKGEIVPLDIVYYPIFKELGFKLRNRIIWHFEHGLHAKKRFSGRYETILFFTKSDEFTFNLDSVRIPSKYPNKRYFKGPRKGELSCNPLGKNPGDIWEIVCKDWENEVWHIPNVKHNHPEKTAHPCQFPVELAERCILVASNEKDVILDPFCGSGSAVIAAIKNNRLGIGVDNNPEYCEIARKRINDLDAGLLKTRPINRQIYQPSPK